MSGVLADGGGIIFVGGVPIRIPPWNPESKLGREAFEISVGLAVLQLASLISNAEVRQQIEGAAGRLISARGQELGQQI
jgi:hypothetical protein